jgi:hypothetical protein
MGLYLTISIDDTQHNSIMSAIMLSVVMLSIAILYCYAECTPGWDLPGTNALVYLSAMKNISFITCNILIRLRGGEYFS